MTNDVETEIKGMLEEYRNFVSDIADLNALEKSFLVPQMKQFWLSKYTTYKIARKKLERKKQEAIDMAVKEVKMDVALDAKNKRAMLEKHPSIKEITEKISDLQMLEETAGDIMETVKWIHSDFRNIASLMEIEKM